MELLVDSRLDELHNKFYSSTISKEEKEELFFRYRHLCQKGVVNEQIIENFLYFTKPEMGFSFF